MPTDDTKSTKAERDAAAKAITDNMARLKALRLAREAASPPAPAKKKAATTSGAKSGKAASGKSAAEKSTEKAQALAAWLADQRNGGRRT